MFLSECTACPAIDLQRTYIKTPTTTQLFDTTSEYEQYNSGCPITQLPVEILFNIFRKAATRRKGKWSRRLGELSKVCRTFRRCVLSRTFTSIHLINYEEDDHSLAPPCTRVKRLYRLIAIDPTIGQYCKHLSIKLPSAKARYRANPLILTPEAYSLAIQLLQFMPNLRTLDVTNGFGQACTLPFFREVLRGRDCLQTLRLIASFGTYDPVELSIDHVWECIRDLQLDELFVACLDPSGYSWEIPKELFKTSSITKLSLLYYGDTPENLETLIRLPNTLHQFTFSIKTEARETKMWSLERIQSLLQTQNESLRTLALDALSDPPVRFSALSFQDFRSLESLSISFMDLLEATPQEACDGLLAPNLHLFILDFSNDQPEDQDYGTIFGREHRDWLLEFAQEAIARRSKLKEIHLLFSPPDASDMDEELEICLRMLSAWPWDLMDEVKEAIKDNIDFWYDRNHAKREEYEALLLGQIPTR